MPSLTVSWCHSCTYLVAAIGLSRLVDVTAPAFAMQMAEITLRTLGTFASFYDIATAPTAFDTF